MQPETETATDSPLRIGELAQQAGVHIQTIRYYERRGLLRPPYRRPSGQRSYAPEVVKVLRQIKTAQGLGFTLDEIEELLVLQTRKQGPALQARTRQKLQEVELKISALSALRDTLNAVSTAGCDTLIDCGCGSCPIPLLPGVRV